MGWIYGEMKEFDVSREIGKECEEIPFAAMVDGYLAYVYGEL